MSVTQFRGIDLTDLTINSDRLSLRPWRIEDVPEIVASLSTGEMHRFLDLPTPYTRDDAVEFVTKIASSERENGTGLDCAAIDRTTGRLVGAVSLRLPFGMRPPDIGYWIAPSAQGNGYATEATITLADWAHAHAVHRVELRIDVANIASAHVALRAGFGFESVRRDGLTVADGHHDLAVFVRVAGDPPGPVARTFPPLPDGELTDEVVALRELLPSDIDGYSEQESDPVTLQYSLTGTTPPRHDMQRRLARSRLDLLVGRAADFAIVDVTSGAFAGSISLRNGGPPGVGGIGYAMHPAFRGRRYTSRALALLIPWAFDQGGFARLELGAKTANIASQRVALTAGFSPDPIAASRLRNADGTFSDEALFSLVNPRYR